MLTSFQYTWIDIVILTVFLSSVLLSLLRGFIQEVSSLLVWGVAIYSSFMFFHLVADSFPVNWSIEIRSIFGFLSILVVVLLISRLVLLSLKETVVFFGGGSVDKFLGGIFGTIRGAVIIITLAILGAMTALPNEKAWTNAISRSMLESSIYCVDPLLPEFLRAKIVIPKDNFNEILNLCVLSSE